MPEFYRLNRVRELRHSVNLRPREYEASYESCRNLTPALINVFITRTIILGYKHPQCFGDGICLCLQMDRGEERPKTGEEEPILEATKEEVTFITDSVI